MLMFNVGQLVRSKSGRLFRVVGRLNTVKRWSLQELGTGCVYAARPGAAAGFTLIGNNYKAKG